MIRKTLLVHTIGFAIVLSVAGFAPPTFACDSDAECGPGGTCIKREKRARGVCYGGRAAAPAATPEPGPNPSADNVPSNSVAAPQVLSPSGDAPIFGEEGYVEPPASSSVIDRLGLPERTVGACITSTDCAGGLECIYRDPMLGHGTCEAPPE